MDAVKLRAHFDNRILRVRTLENTQPLFVPPDGQNRMRVTHYGGRLEPNPLGFWHALPLQCGFKGGHSEIQHEDEADDGGATAFPRRPPPGTPQPLRAARHVV